MGVFLPMVATLPSTGTLEQVVVEEATRRLKDLASLEDVGVVELVLRDKLLEEQVLKVPMVDIPM